MAAAIEHAINYPEWTEYRKKNGLDPLGMQNSSIALYQSLLPGVSNVTLRMRYYGLYAWLCRIYAKRIGDTNPERWKCFIRRAEALYALIAWQHGGESGVAGIEWSQRALEIAGASESVDFGAAAEPGSENYYLKQAWGAYGAAYRSQLFEIGIFDDSDDHELPLPSTVGERLAEAFEQNVGESAERFFTAIERGKITRMELSALASLAPSAIGRSTDERQLYQDILLNPADDDGLGPHSRRLTMLLILQIAALLGRHPKVEEVRWILYSGVDPDGNALSLPTLELQAQRRLWWIYHANDLCHIAYEALLKFSLDTLGEHPGGVTLMRLIQLCVERIAQAAGPLPRSWQALLDATVPAENPYGRTDGTDWSLAGHILRTAGRSDAQVCPAATAWLAIRLLATLHRRVRNQDQLDLSTVLGSFNPDGFHSLLTETRFLETGIDLPLPLMLGRLLEQRVLQRHLWVALQKFRAGDYTFLIERDEGKVRLRAKDGPVFTNPRLGPALTFLRDIHVIDEKGLTDHGAAAAGLA